MHSQMAHHNSHSKSAKQESLESLRDMNLKEEDDDGSTDMDNIDVHRSSKGQQSSASSMNDNKNVNDIKMSSESPMKMIQGIESPAIMSDKEEVVGGDVTLKLQPGRPAKLSRTTSRKIERRAPPLFADYDDSTAEACSSFTILKECTYANKYLGTTEPALECDCSEEWDASTGTNEACGEDSDCINRATKMECVGDCGCGGDCQNRRFQQKRYANVSVIKTEKKGFGLRTDTELAPNDFIFEYIGEVIGENVFRRRMQLYDEEGIKHFYFMSLSHGEFVDATKRGNLGRFCNHSCNPNCYVDKWVVDDKLRMGIFAERQIKAGEELVFNYNVDRYGADPQPCYCGEPNCTGYIGGKTQTERATKLSNAIIEALGIDDADAWDTVVAKKPRKKKQGEDDEEYVNNVVPRGLDEDGVKKVMSSLMQCKEKWIAVKLLSRIQRAEDERVRNCVVQFHGYRIMKTVLSNFSDDVNICLQVLEILDMMPRLTRNKVQDSKIEEAVQPLTTSEDERVATRAADLMSAWTQLEIGYRIPRMKRDPNASKVERVERRDFDERRRRSKSRTKSPERLNAPTGPRGATSGRGGGFFGGPRPPPRFRPPPPPQSALPAGWLEAKAANGTVYYYNNAGATTWQRPTIAAIGAPPPPPPKAISDQQMLHDLIKNIVESKKEGPKANSLTATPADTPRKERKEEKWKSYPLDKQKKLYEGAIQPHLMHVVGKYKHKLAKDDLKRWAKELAKKMVDGDFKKGRVTDPMRISDKQAKNIKKHAQEFFEKAVKKKADADKRKAEKKAGHEQGVDSTPAGSELVAALSPADQEGLEVTMSDDEVDEPDATPAESNGGLSVTKRRLSDGTTDDAGFKRQRTESEDAEARPAPPPPPPPPPPLLAELEMASGEDVSGSFTHEAITAVYNATCPDSAAYTGADMDNVEDHTVSAKHQLAHGDNMQIATPPTTGSPDVEVSERSKLLADFTGINPERMRLMESTSE